MLTTTNRTTDANHKTQTGAPCSFFNQLVSLFCAKGCKEGLAHVLGPSLPPPWVLSSVGPWGTKQNF